MAKQTFTTGSVLTAAQMNNLQANDYNWSVDSKSASYVLVAADAGKRIEMNAAGATTITVNTGLFTAGDMVYLSNIGAGVCTVTAGTATVNKSTNASLALSQYQSGILYFVSASSSIFYPFDIGAVPSTPNFTLLGTGTTTSGSTVTVSGISNINTLMIRMIGVGGDTSNTVMGIRFNSDNSSNYRNSYIRFDPATTWNTSAITSSNGLLTYIDIGRTAQVTTGTVNGIVMVQGCNSSGDKIFITNSGGANGTNGDQRAYSGGGHYTSSSTISSVSLVNTTGNFNAGSFTVYGSA